MVIVQVIAGGGDVGIEGRRSEKINIYINAASLVQICPYLDGQPLL